MLEWLGEADPALAAEVDRVRCVFEDVTRLDDRAVQHVLRMLEMDDLAKALHGAGQEIHDKIVRNMSRRAAGQLKEDMEYMGPVRIQDVEQAQRKIAGVICSLEQNGTLKVARSSRNELIT